MGTVVSFSRAWYAFEFVRELVLIYPVYAIMIGEAGVSPFGLSILLFVWSSTAIVLEVPTGTLADRMPRPPLIAVGLASKACGFLTWWLVPSFAGFLAGFVLWGLGSALRSGAAESLLYDKLAALRSTERLEHVYGRGEAAHSTGALTAMVIGGWAATGGYALPLVLSALGPLAAAGILLRWIGDAPRSQPPPTRESPVATLLAGLREVRASRTLRQPILLLCTAVVAYEAGEEYFAPWYRELGLSLPAVGLALAASLLAHVLGFFFAAWLRRRRVPVLAVFLVAGLLLTLGARAGDVRALPALWLFVALIAAGKVLLFGRVQRVITGHARATVISAIGMGQELSSLGVFLAIGAIATRTSWTTSFFCLGVALLATVATLGMVASRRQRT